MSGIGVSVFLLLALPKISGLYFRILHENHTKEEKNRSNRDRRTRDLTIWRTKRTVATVDTNYYEHVVCDGNGE